MSRKINLKKLRRVELNLFLTHYLSKDTDDGRLLRELVFEGHMDKKTVAKIMVKQRPELKSEFDEILKLPN